MSTTYLLNLERTWRRIERARIAYDRHQIVNLLAISKYQNPESIQALYECGQRAFGENKVQDLRAKCEVLDELPLEWHFVGRLQENKINALLAQKPALIHSIDSLKTAEAIEARLLKTTGRKQRALLQINAANEPSKSGVSISEDIEEALQTYEQILKSCPNIALEGLMCIGAHSEDRREIEKSFAKTREVFDALQAKYGREVKTLSMGMSGDFEIAIAHGANLVRIGSRLFEGG